MLSNTDIIAELDQMLDDWAENLASCDQQARDMGYENCIFDLRQYVETLRYPPPERDYLK